jgi:sulfoxide reductase heme-binding subunit YedZ
MEPVHAIAASIGFSSMALLWLALIAGLALARGWTMTRIKHSTLLAIHFSLAILGLTLGMVHGVAQIFGPAQTVKLIDTYVPFTNPVDPIGIGVGVIGIELMIALVLSVGIQKWLGFHRWRAVHATAYASYTLVTGHIFISGSEVEGYAVQGAVIAPWFILMALWLMPGTSRAPGAGAGDMVDDDFPMADRVTTRLRGKLTTVQVNPVKCARFGFCEQEAPEIFTLRGDGQLAYRAVVADHQVDAVQRAVRACPARAIAMQNGGANGRGAQTLVPPGAVVPNNGRTNGRL